MSTTTNYTVTGINGPTTRKVDLYIMGDLQFGESRMQQTSPTLGVESGGKVCAGLAKLAQKVVCVMLSFDIVYDFDWGTGLYQILLSGNMAAIKRYIGTLMSGYIDTAIHQIQSTESLDTPADESLLLIQSNGWIIDRAAQKIVLNLVVVSKTQEAAQIVVPISVVP